MTFDVKTAFLHGELDEKIIMYEPEGFNDKSGRICELKKNLYGLKQSPKNWNKKFTDFLNSLHFESADDDPCVYYNKDRSHRDKIILPLFHINLGHVKEFVESLEKNGECFKYICRSLPRLSIVKLKG